jgi:hypothetical protein
MVIRVREEHHSMPLKYAVSAAVILGLCAAVDPAPAAAQSVNCADLYNRVLAAYRVAPLSLEYNQMAAAYVASCLAGGSSAAPAYLQYYGQYYSPSYQSYYGYAAPSYQPDYGYAAPSYQSDYGYAAPDYGGYGYGIPAGIGLGFGFAHGFHRGEGGHDRGHDRGGHDRGGHDHDRGHH